MTKPALAAIFALALSISMPGLMTSAQQSSDSSQTPSGLQHTFSAPQQASRTRQATPGFTPLGWQTTTLDRVKISQAQPGKPAATTTTTTTTATATATTPATATTKTTTTTTAPAAKKVADDTILVAQSQNKNVATKAGWEKFYDYITLKPGQDQLPLILVVTNGSASHAPFQAVRLFLSGQQLASEKDFKDNVLQMKMDGTLSPGQNQLTIEGYGQPGAGVSWKLNTNRAVLTSVKPDSVAPGETITIQGRNFSNKTGVTQIWVGDKPATVTSGNGKTLTATVPLDALQGENKLIVAVGGIPAKPLKITVKSPAPELSGTDLYGAPPGTAITVSGKNFSTTSSDNIVTINGTPASVTSSTATSLTFLMPELPNVYGAAQLSVKTKGVSSKNSLPITASNRLLTSPYP